MADDFLNYAFDFYLKKGWQPHQAAALAGQAQWESGGDPMKSHDGGTGRGLMGWRLDRRKNLESAKDNKTVPGQLEFSNWELGNTEKGAGDALRNAKDYSEATNAVLGYLRPSGYTAKNPMGSHGYAERYNLGAGLLNQPPMASPTDPRTAGDADLGGYGGSPRLQQQQPADGAKFQSASNKLTGMGLGLLSAGEAPAPQMPAWVQQAMAGGGGGGINRPQAQGGLLTSIFSDPEEEKRRRLLSGLLGGQ